MYLLYFVYQLVHYEEKKRKKRFTCTWRHFTVLHSKYFVYWYILYEEKNKRKSQRRDYLFIGKFRRNPFDIFCSWYISPQASRFISQHTRAKRLKQRKHVLGEYMYKWTEKDKISVCRLAVLFFFFFFLMQMIWSYYVLWLWLRFKVVHVFFVSSCCIFFTCVRLLTMRGASVSFRIISFVLAILTQNHSAFHLTVGQLNSCASSTSIV